MYHCVTSRCNQFIAAARCTMGLRLVCNCGLLTILLASIGCDGSYRSEAWMRYEEITILEKKPRPSEPKETFLEFVENQTVLILSPLVLEQVLARPDIAQISSLSRADSPVKMLQECVRVEPHGKQEIMVISCTWSDPEEAATIANAVVEAYFRMHTQDEAQRATRVVELLEDERARRLVGVQQLRDALKAIRTHTSQQDDAERELIQSALRASYLKLRTQRDETALQLAEVVVANPAPPVAETDTEVDSESKTPVASVAKSDEQLKLERRLQAIAVREAEVLAELNQAHLATSISDDLRWKLAELKREEEMVDQISERIQALRVEMTAPARVTLLRKAEPSSR